MRRVFNAGTDVLRSEVTSLGPRGPYQLTIQHRQGTIVEYFPTSQAALLRQAELEKLLISARGADAAKKEPR